MARACRLTGDPEACFHHLQIAKFLGWPSHLIDLEQRLGVAQSKNIWKVEEGLKKDVLEASPAEKPLIIEALINGYLVNDRPNDAYHFALAWTLEYPEDWQAFLSLGRACQLKMSFDKAIKSFEKVLELKPDQPKARLWLAQTLALGTEFEQAKEQYQVFLRNAPDDPEGLVGLAKCQYSLGDVQGAQETLDYLLGQDPNSVPGLLARGQLVQSRAPEEALPWLQKAVAIEPNDPNILYNLILALRAAHKDQDATFYDQRLKANHAKTTQLTNLILEVLKDANNVDLRYQIAALNLELGKEEEAAHWFQTVLWIDPDHRPTLRALADYWRKHKDVQRAAFYAGRAEGNIPGMSTP